MRYLVGLAVVVALVALPLSVKAQDGEQGEASEPDVVEVVPTPEPAPEEPPPSPETVPKEPALQLELDDAGIGVAPSPRRTAKGYTQKEMKLRVKRAKIGFYVSLLVLGAGSAILIAASLNALSQYGEGESFDRAETAMLTGGVLLSAGLVGLVTSGILWSTRKRDRDTLWTAHHGTPPRVQWDVARSRLVF